RELSLDRRGPSRRRGGRATRRGSPRQEPTLAPCPEFARGGREAEAHLGERVDDGERSSADDRALHDALASENLPRRAPRLRVQPLVRAQALAEPLRPLEQAVDDREPLLRTDDAH